LIEKKKFDLVVQVSGKTRATISLPVGVSQDDAEKAARTNTSVAKHLEGKTQKKIIFVPNKLINFVI
ncbi:hypothetical protein KGQ34_04685, partial [Patescibacteria group bacterium]|nr:hypothetical protein [Patescibacteria group bacterium]